MITLNDTLDVTEHIAPVTSDQANYSDIFGLIAKQREYVLNDPDGRYHPYSARGYFNRYPWRAMSIKETDENGATVFDGQIYDIEPRDDGKKRTITLYCRDPLGVKLDWYVDLCDLTTYDGWQTSGVASAGATTVVLSAISGSPTDIAVNSVVSFNDEYTPSYLVTAINTGTDTITLDRALAETVPANTAVNVAVPTLETPAGAIKRALTAAGIGDKVDASFDLIDTTDTTASRYFWFFVQPQNKIKLRAFIEQVQEMGDIYISVSATGVIYARRGLAHDSVTIRKTITSSEIIAPLTGPRPDTTRLIYGYDVLYPIPATSVQVNGVSVPFTGEVRKASNTVDAATLEDSAPTNIWSPVSLGTSDLRDYTILYWNETTALYFGERRLSYFGVARPRLKFGLKRAKSGEPENRYTIALFDDFEISYPVSRNQNDTEQNGVVMGYGYNAQNMRYDFVEVELSGVSEVTENDTNMGDDMYTGQYFEFAGTTAPSGSLACDGTSYLRADYVALFAVIGTTYGADDDTHFNVPDRRGISSVGAGAHGTMTKAAGGAFDGGSVGDTRNDQFQGHWHGVRGYGSDADHVIPTTNAGANNNGPLVTGNGGTLGANQYMIVSPETDTVNGTTRTGNETRPAQMAVLVCIKT